MLTPEEKDIRDLEYAYEFQMRIAERYAKYKNTEIVSTAVARAGTLMEAAHKLRVQRVNARFRSDN